MSVAKSIAKWTKKNVTIFSFKKYVEETHSSEIQRSRGAKSKGGGRPSLGQPWILLGVSRATYFRIRNKNGIS